MNFLFDIKFLVSRIRVKFELMFSFFNLLELKKKKRCEFRRGKRVEFIVIFM